MIKVNRNLHILIIPSWYPQFEGDIGGNFFREQALALNKAGHKVGVIFPQFRSIKDLRGLYSKPYGIKYMNDGGLHTFKYHHTSLPRLHKIQQKRWIDSGLKLFQKYIKEFGVPDIIHVHSLKPAGYLALIIKSKYKVPFVVTEHSTAFARGLIKKSEVMNLKNVVDASNYNIAVSQPFSSLLNSLFEVGTWNYIPNIVNDDFLNTKRKVMQKKFIFLTVSLLTTKKAVDILIKAFSCIRNEIPNAVLHIGGDGEERGNLEKLVKDLSLEDQVIFLGRLSRERVKSEMERSSVFVLPSRYETFGVVLVEALALGCPVIATKCGGPESIVIDKVGSLVKVDDITGLSEAMLNAYINYDKYNSEDIRQYCIDNFSEEAVTSQLTELYHSVLVGFNR